MMTQPGFSKAFVTSGDLRLHLAMQPPDSEEFKRLQPLVTYDDLITSSDEVGGRDILGYSPSALANRETFKTTVLLNSEPFPKETGSFRGLRNPMQYEDGVCVVVGSAINMNISEVQELRKLGVVIVALGNSVHAGVDPDIWIGHQDILGYVSRGIEDPSVLALLPLEYMQQKMWEHGAKKESHKTPAETVNTFGYTADSRTVTEFLEDPRRPSDFGYSSTLPVAISLLTMMGFRDIILNGVRLGGDVDDFFSFDEIPHREVFDTKTERYSKLRAGFKDLYKDLTAYSIRVSVCGEDTGLPLPHFDIEYLRTALAGIMTLYPRITEDTRVALPTSAARKQISSRVKHKEALVTPRKVLENADGLIEHLPQFFDKPDIRQRLQEARVATAGADCPSCTMNRLAAPLFRVFEEAVLTHYDDVQAAWKTVLPDHYILRPRRRTTKEYVFREDHAEEEQTYNEVSR
jgi:hypothetical protein